MFGDNPRPYPITFRAGATLQRTFGIAVDGIPWDMSTWTSDAVIRLTDVRGVPLIGLPALQSTSTYNLTTKEWTLVWSATNSSALTPTIALPSSVYYLWDWKLTTAGGIVYVPLAGVVTVLPKVT